MLKIQIEQEQDGRWIGEVPELPGVRPNMSFPWHASTAR